MKAWFQSSSLQRNAATGRADQNPKRKAGVRRLYLLIPNPPAYGRRRRPAGQEVNKPRRGCDQGSLRVGDAETELVGDGPSYFVSQSVELLLDGRQRRRGQRAPLGACDAREEEDGDKKVQGDDEAPPLKPERLGIAHSVAGEELSRSTRSGGGGEGTTAAKEKRARK